MPEVGQQDECGDNGKTRNVRIEVPAHRSRTDAIAIRIVPWTGTVGFSHATRRERRPNEGVYDQRAAHRRGRAAAICSLGATPRACSVSIISDRLADAPARLGADVASLL